MIRINLLPHRELKRAARRRQFNVLLILALALAIAVVAIGQGIVTARISIQDARNQFLSNEIARLDAQIKEIDNIRGQTTALLGRKRVVETLQSDRTVMVHLFDEMVRVLPEGMYLKAIKQSGDNLTLVGSTQSSSRVSTLMRNLDASPWFQQPSLVEIRGGDFTLTVKQAAGQTTNQINNAAAGK